MTGPSAKELIDVLPPLSLQNPKRDYRRCKLCDGPALFFDVVDFSKFCSKVDFYALGHSGVPVRYWRCSNCAFLFTDFFDDWSSEDWSRLIYNEDYVRVDGDYLEERPREFARLMANRFRTYPAARILDYGSGRGVFAENMRKSGFESVENYDPVSSPQRPQGLFEIITCFEVMEHSPDPLVTLADMRRYLAPGGCILFSQTLQPPDIQEIRANWWYAAPRNGHISLYTRRTLAKMAQRTGLAFCGHEGLFVFKTPQPSRLVETTLQDFGQPLFVHDLFAPPGNAQGIAQSLWHAVEVAQQGSFRWSASHRLHWHLPLLPIYPCELHIDIPVVMRIHPQILDGARIHVGNETAPISVDESGAYAQIILPAPGASELILTTQKPRSPAELHGSPDQRLLGIAVSVGDTPAQTPKRLEHQTS